MRKRFAHVEASLRDAKPVVEMPVLAMAELQFFDPKQDVAITYKNLPHWAQAGTMVFITWRTADSLPAAAQRRITSERNATLRQFGLAPNRDYSADLAKRPVETRGRLKWSLFETWDQQLDAGAGSCLLARPELSRIVNECLLHFDRERYFLTDFVVMPNHVHLRVAFHGDEALIKQCTSWKRITGTQINQLLSRNGEFWQVEQFDHLVRGPEQFEHYRRYIRDNPLRAKLAAGTYRLYSKNLN